MARYIDTNYLFKCQTCRHFDGDECDTFCDSYECYSPDMSKIPTADVVEVVRCKDCKFRFVDGNVYCGNPLAPWTNDIFENLMSADDFCSYGKRKKAD